MTIVTKEIQDEIVALLVDEEQGTGLKAELRGITKYAIAIDDAWPSTSLDHDRGIVIASSRRLGMSHMALAHALTLLPVLEASDPKPIQDDPFDDTAFLESLRTSEYDDLVDTYRKRVRLGTAKKLAAKEMRKRGVR